MSKDTDTSFVAGLEDVVSNTSDICFLDGKEGRLVYQGYNIHDLVNGNASFEEVVYLLWHGELPNRQQLDEFKHQIGRQRALTPDVLNFLKGVRKDANAMEVLRTAVSFAGIYDPDNGDESYEANVRKATRLVAQIPTIVTTFERIRNGQDPIEPDPELSAASSFFQLLTGQVPNEFTERAFNIALILHADHELNASTFSARVTAATLSDMYSAITSAIGTLKGPLHGGANEQVMKMLLEIGDMSRVESYIDEALAAKRKIMGFGHRVYRTEDPRATHLRKLSQKAGELAGETKWFEMSADRTTCQGQERPQSERGFLLGFPVLFSGSADASVQADLRVQPHFRMDCPRARTVPQQSPDPSACRVHRADPSPVRPAV